VRIQYCSDIHLEFDKNSKYLINNPLGICGDVLILAGDIIPLHDEFLNNQFFNFISKSFRQIFWVPGNHEYYYRSISDYGNSFNFKLHGNINVINNVELHFEGIHFIFSTLWSKISEKNEKYIEQNVSDFDCITNNGKKLKVSDINKLHEESLNFLRKSADPEKSRVVIVTHHLPSYLCNKPAHNRSIINEAFSVDLTDFIKMCNASFWIYGHSHFNQKPLHIGNTILLTNQLGYIEQNEQDGFRRNAYFSI
jgi:Icc-related predicted phosphoesterase